MRMIAWHPKSCCLPNLPGDSCPPVWWWWAGAAIAVVAGLWGKKR